MSQEGEPQPNIEQQNNENNDNNNAQENGEQQEPLTEEQMKQQEMEDDADLKALKEKLQKLQDKKPPEDKDELINHLMERLEQAEYAITAAEDVISHERQNRKAMSAELKTKNSELRALVEKEKRTLQDKVHDELEITLQQALKEKMHAEQQLNDFKKIMVERDMYFEELDQMFLSLRDDSKINERMVQDQQKIIENLEEELTQVKNDRDHHQNQSEERQKTIDKLNSDLDEAHGCLIKLEEARIVLNKLMGPGGVITEREREKYLKNVSGGEQQQQQQYNEQSQGNGTFNQQNSGRQLDSKDNIMGASNKMLNQNNQYFYEGKNTQKPPKNPYGNIQQNATLMDDANEDDFWYQTPKVDGGLSGEYQGYNQYQQPGSANRTGSRRQGGPVINGGRY